MAGRQIPPLSRAPMPKGSSDPAKGCGADRREKPRRGVCILTVPQTDTRRRGEKPKVLE